MNPTRPPYSQPKIHCTDTAIRNGQWANVYAPGLVCLPIDENGELIPLPPANR